MTVTKRKLSSNFERREIKWYFNFNKPEKAHPKVKVLEKAQTFTGTYQHTFREETVNEAGQPQVRLTHLIYDETLDAITIPGCKSLNEALESVKRGTRLEIVFQGRAAKSKNPKNKMRKPPYIFDVYELPDDADLKIAPATSTAPAAAQETAERYPDEDDDSDIEF
jgi:hypothetical protein